MSSYTSRITSADRDVFRNADPFADIPYHGVYARGRTYRVCEPFTKRKLGTYPSVVTAVDALVQWWRDHYGPEWAAVHAARTHEAYSVDPVKTDPGEQPFVVCNPKGLKILSRRGWRLTAWVWGVPQVVPPPVAHRFQPLDRARREGGQFASGGRPTPCDLFASREWAVAYYHRWRHLGLFEPVSLLVYRRAGPAPRPSRQLACV